MEYLSLDIPVHAWLRIDACADNAMAVDVVESLMESVFAGAAVREAGWRAASEYDGELDPFGWPPTQHPLRIVLRRSHWDWVLEQLDRWTPYEHGETLPAVRDFVRGELERS